MHLIKISTVVSVEKMSDVVELIKPFEGLRVDKKRAQEVVSPPYDVLSRNEAKGLAAGKPWNFLRVTRSEIDWDEDISETDESVYQKAYDNLQSLIKQGVLSYDPTESYYLYSISKGDFKLRGIIGVFSTNCYKEGRVVRHELTKPDKEKNRADQLNKLGVQPSPVLMTVPSADELGEFISSIPESQDDIVVEDQEGYRHCLTTVSETEKVQRLTSIVNALPAVYIADGHHRSSAASSLPDCSHFLAGLFRSEEMVIKGYHRGIVPGVTPICDDFIASLESAGTLSKCDDQDGRLREPTAGSCYIFYQDKRYLFSYAPVDPSHDSASHDAVSQLDSFRLSNQILKPFFGITNLRIDKRVVFVGGIEAHEMAHMVEKGELEYGFYVAPTKISELIAVAKAGQLMPPKSTWFDPKLLDGLISYRFRSRSRSR